MIIIAIVIVIVILILITYNGNDHMPFTSIPTGFRPPKALPRGIHTELRAVLPLVELDGQVAAVVAVSNDDARRALAHNDRAAIPHKELF